jgi:hypothetical protein
MKTMTLAEFHAALNAQGVSGREHLAFKCPICGTIQSGNDLLTAGAGTDFDAIEKYLAFSRVGRFSGAPAHRNDADPGRGCDWTLGGLLKLHKLEVITDDGKRHPRFEPATPEEAQAHECNQADPAKIGGA